MGEKGLGFAPKTLITSVILLSACASKPADVALRDTYVQPDAPARLYASATVAPRPDTCGAAHLAWMVGRPRTEIPVPVDFSNRWVRSSAAAAPPGVRPERLNIVYDPATQRVQAVACG